MSWHTVVAPALLRLGLVCLGALLAALVEAGWLGPRAAAVLEEILSGLSSFSPV